MIWYVCAGMLAAFGLLCAVWLCLGGLLRGGRGGAVVCLCCPGGREAPFLRRCAWLREVGLLRGPILLIDGGLSPGERAALLRCCPGGEWCAWEALPARLEREQRKYGGTGNGNDPGHDYGCGISEL